MCCVDEMCDIGKYIGLIKGERGGLFTLALLLNKKHQAGVTKSENQAPCY